MDTTNGTVKLIEMRRVCTDVQPCSFQVTAQRLVILGGLAKSFEWGVESKRDYGLAWSFEGEPQPPTSKVAVFGVLFKLLHSITLELLLSYDAGVGEYSRWRNQERFTKVDHWTLAWQEDESFDETGWKQWGVYETLGHLLNTDGNIYLLIAGFVGLCKWLGVTRADVEAEYGDFCKRLAGDYGHN